MIGAAVSPTTAATVGSWADGIITVNQSPEALRRVELGFDGVWIHHVGQHQESFIDAFGEHVVPSLRAIKPELGDR